MDFKFNGEKQVLDGMHTVFWVIGSQNGGCSMLGGGTNMLIGDLIDLQFLGASYNPHLGSAISLVLMVFILVCMSITNSLDDEEMEGVIV